MRTLHRASYTKPMPLCSENPPRICAAIAGRMSRAHVSYCSMSFSPLEHVVNVCLVLKTQNDTIRHVSQSWSHVRSRIMPPQTRVSIDPRVLHIKICCHRQGRASLSDSFGWVERVSRWSFHDRVSRHRWLDINERQWLLLDRLLLVSRLIVENVRTPASDVFRNDRACIFIYTMFV